MDYLILLFARTSVILLLQAGLAWTWCFILIRGSRTHKNPGVGHGCSQKSIGLINVDPVVPCLLIAPVCLFLVYKTTQYNLLVVPDQQKPLFLIFRYGVISIILFVGTGMPQALSGYIAYYFMKAKKSNYYKSSLALGFPAKTCIYKFVLIRSLSRSYLDRLGIIFTELFVLEPLMNFPGLASQVWQTFLKTKWIGFVPSTLMFLGCFYLFILSAKLADSWLSKRLKGYDF